MALLATLVDGFTTIAAGTWTTSGNVIVDPVVGGMARLEVPIAAATSASLTSVSSFDATASSISAQVGVPTGNGLTNNLFEMRVQLNSTNYALMRFDGTSLITEVSNAGVLTTFTFGNYNPSTQEFWQLSFSGGTVSFKISATGNAGGYSTANTAAYTFAITAVKAIFTTSHPSGTATNLTYAWVDNVNIAPNSTNAIFSVFDPMTGPKLNGIRWNPLSWSSAPYVPSNYVAQDGNNPWTKIILNSTIGATVVSGLVTPIQYALTGSSLSARIIPGSGLTGVPYVESTMRIFAGATNYGQITCQGTTMLAQTNNAGVVTQTTIGSYDSTAHAYWQIVELSGNLLYQVSPDGSTWTQVASHAHSFLTTGGLNVQIGQSYPSGTPTGTSNMYVDMVATVPTAPGITVTPNATTGSNTVGLTGLSTFQNVQLTRNNFDGSFTGVRNANPFLGVLGTSTQSFSDYEAPIGVANSYTAVAYVPAPDGTTMYSATATSSAATITAPTGQTVWLKSLSTPSLSNTFRLSAMEDLVRPARQQVYGVVGRRAPVVVADLQGSRVTTLTFHVRSRAERSNLLALMAAGTALFLQADSSRDGFEDMYFQVTGDSSENYTGKASGVLDRQVTMAVTEVDAPAGATTAIAGNSWLLVSSFASWSAVSTSRTSWQDVLNRPFGS